jgi:Tfp pilus assembly ATPase PilU
MQTFDGVLEKMIREGVVTREGALPYATNANNLLLRLNDMSGSTPAPVKRDPEKTDSMLDLIER